MSAVIQRLLRLQILLGGAMANQEPSVSSNRDSEIDVMLQQLEESTGLLLHSDIIGRQL